MPTFNVIFEGVTPSPAREVIAEAIIKAEPEILLMPAAGRFGATEAVIKAGYPPDRINCSDISLFSSIIGYLADSELQLGELGISFHGAGQAFAEGLDLEGYQEDFAAGRPVEAEDQFEIAAAAMLAVKYEQLKPKHQYAVNLRRELWHNRLKYRDRLKTELQELVAGIRGIHYTIGDLRAQVIPLRDQESMAFYVNPPGYSAEAYVRMLHAETVSWNRQVPDDPWDKPALKALYEEFTDAPMTAIAYSINAEFVPDSWHRLLAVSRKGDRTDYVVSNKPIAVVHALTEHTQAAGGKPRIFEVYNDQEITADSHIEFVEIDRPTVMYYRDLFVHRLGTTQSEWYIALLIDGRLVTVIGLNRQRFMHFKSGYVKETFGISVTSQRYKRIGRLFMLLLTTTAFRDWMRLHGRYGIREMLGIETTSLTKHEVSKNDRALMKLVSREQLPNGTFKLQYRADLRDETFQEVLTRWLDTEARHSRQGDRPAVEAQPARESRASRRKRKRQQAAEEGSDGRHQAVPD